MERVDPDGDGPGWVFRHRALVIGSNQIRIWGRQVAAEKDGKEVHEENPGTFVLDLDLLQWYREEER